MMQNNACDFSGFRPVCKCCETPRPRWTTLHPDNWTVLEVAEWLTHVAQEYSLGHRVKDSLTRSFCDVDGRRLMAMTQADFLDLDPLYGDLLFSVLRDVVSAVRLGHLDVPGPDTPHRTLTPIREQEQQVSQSQGGYDGRSRSYPSLSHSQGPSPQHTVQGPRQTPQGSQAHSRKQSS